MWLQNMCFICVVLVVNTLDYDDQVTMKKDPIEIANLKDLNENTTLEQSIEIATLEDSNNITTLKDPIEVTILKEPIEITTLDEPIEATTSEVTIEVTTSEDPNEVTTSEDTIEVTTSEDPIEFTTSEDPNEFTTSEDPIEVTTSEDQNEVTPSEDPIEVTTLDDPIEVTTLEEAIEITTAKNDKKKPSEIILALIEHFKQENPIGLPEELVEDPGHVPDSEQYMPFGVTMYFKDTLVYGVSKFHVQYIHIDIERMEVKAALSMDALQSCGNYTMRSWFDSADGTYSINVTNLNVTGRTTLGAQLDGKLKVQDIEMDPVLSSITTDFSNLGLVGGMFQNAVNTGGTSMFDSMKPYMLDEAYKNIRNDVNAKLDKFVGDMQFSNTIPILDTVFIKVREKIRDMHLDPFHVDDYNTTDNAITFNLFNTWMSGLSSFQRVGNVTVKIENNTAVIEFDIGVQSLQGITQWELSALAGFIAKEGTASFSVEYMSANVIIAQPLDTRKKPTFKDLDLDVGNIQVRCDGLGTLDYVVELSVNVLPNLLRYQILDTMKGSFKDNVQQEFDALDVENLIKDELPTLDEMQDVKLSDLIGTNINDKIYDEDEFFNF